MRVCFGLLLAVPDKFFFFPLAGWVQVEISGDYQPGLCRPNAGWS